MAATTSSASAAGDAAIVTGEAVVLDVRSTPVILRGAGTVIDALVSLTLFGGILWLLSLTGADAALMRALLILTLVTCIVIVPMVVETASRGRSLGRLAIGARIVRDDGGAISLRHAFVRALTGAVEIYLTFGSVAVITGLLTEKGKRLGDLMAGTHSQLERVPRYVAPTVDVPAPLAQWATAADVARLPVGLSRRIAQFLAGSSALMPATRERVAVDLAREASGYVSPLPDAPPEAFLVAVAALRRERERVGLDLEARRLATLQPVLTGLPHGFPER